MFSNFALRVIHRINPYLIWKLYAYKCEELLNKSRLILSFDCDTEDDISVVWDVHSKLLDMGITPVYAVPGKLLEKGEKVYQKIYDTGAEFINHGGREHTYFDASNQRHESCFFYDQQPFDILREDFLLGHQTLQNVLGITATGWRTPHFGTFQEREHLTFLYVLLNEYGYKYSTSTVPMKSYYKGPFYKDQNIIEIPVTGSFSEPFNIMDTWGYYASPERKRNANDYIIDCNNLSNFSSKYPILINIYGDPSHIHNQPGFFHSLHSLINNSNNLNYTQLIELNKVT
jgi:hypothetical protein